MKRFMFLVRLLAMNWPWWGESTTIVGHKGDHGALRRMIAEARTRDAG